MTYNFLTMRNIFSVALKIQPKWQCLEPVQLARLCTKTAEETVAQNAEETILQNAEGIDPQKEDKLIAEIIQKAKAERCLNDVRLLGRIVTTPKLHQKNLRPCLMFQLITTSKVVNELNDEFTRIEWHSIVVHYSQKLKETENALKAGDRILVHGKLVNHKNTTGEQRARVILKDFVLMN